MGVTSLWPLLEPVRQTRSLPELKGQKIAIDLSAWIVGSKRVAVASGFRNVYLRTIFLRTLDLLKCGILPVFVCDGCIPKIKFDKIQSRSKSQSFEKSGPIFRERSQAQTTRICLHLFECLGLPCLESEGEGEALCAFLNNEQIVDACLTSDSDVLLYGARKVYRNYTKKNKIGYLEAYDTKDINNQMKLDQRALVSLALLLGCDYNQMGVPGVGVKTAVRMIRELQQKNIDTLQRMQSWRANQELQDLQEQMDIFHEEKHCNECLHIVTLGKRCSKLIGLYLQHTEDYMQKFTAEILEIVVSHSQNGCDLCGDNINVSEDLEDCQCSCHTFLQKFLSHEEEFKVRQKALIDPNFPSQEVIEEFLIPTESKDLKADINWHEPNLEDLQKFVLEHLHWNGQVLLKTLVPLLIHWKLNSSTFSCLQGLEPLRIRKKHRKNYKLVYEVEWSKTIEDVWTKDATYICSVDRDLFRKGFPEMVKHFEQSLQPAKIAEGKKKKTILTHDRRVTRSSLKKQNLTLSDVEVTSQTPDSDIHQTESHLCSTPVKQSKRLIAKIADGKKKKAIPTYGHHVTRSSLKKQNLTLSDVEVSSQTSDSNIDQTESHPCATPVRQSKRLIEKKTENIFLDPPVRVTRSSVQFINSLGSKRSMEYLDEQPDSIPDSVTGKLHPEDDNLKLSKVRGMCLLSDNRYKDLIIQGIDRIKKLKKTKPKVKPVSLVDMPNGRNVSAQVISSKYFNLIGRCTVTVKRIPSFFAIKAEMKRLSVNKNKIAEGGKISLSTDSEDMDCVEVTKIGSKAEDEENALNCRNRVKKSPNHIPQYLDGMVVDVTSNGIDVTVDDSRSKNIVEDSKHMDLIVEGTQSKDVMLNDSNATD